jgi:hypothetical protein
MTDSIMLHLRGVSYVTQLTGLRGAQEANYAPKITEGNQISTNYIHPRLPVRLSHNLLPLTLAFVAITLHLRDVPYGILLMGRGGERWGHHVPEIMGG